MHVEPQTGRLYYVNSEDGSSSWENPLTESCLRPVIDIGRGYLQAPSDGYFEEQKMALWAAHKHNLEGWHGPHVDEDGREYYANSELNVSSWQDPREETQFIFELQSGLLDALEEQHVGAASGARSGQGGRSTWRARSRSGRKGPEAGTDLAQTWHVIL
eukprot:g13986.t1